MEQEVNEADLLNHGLMIQMDGNLHAGDLVKNDPNIQNKNGKMFSEFLGRNKSLVVLNCQDACKGLITRKRVFEERTDEAVLDFFVINEKLRPFFKQMLIDEDKNFCLSNISQLKKNGRIIETDHNAMIAEFDLIVEGRKPERQEMFNLRNKDCQAAFRNATENNPELLECFKNNLPFETQSKRGLKSFNSLLYKHFRKIRKVNNKKKENKMTMKSLITDRIKLKQDLKVKKNTEDMKTQI